MYDAHYEAQRQRAEIMAQQDHDIEAAGVQANIARVRRDATPLSNGFLYTVSSVPWLAALIFVLAHGFERHQFPALPYGIPLLIGILVAALGVLITTRFKFSWMVLSFAAATYAAFNL